MEPIKKECIQCKQHKPLDQYFIYKKSGKPYSWCKDCVNESSAISMANHKAKSKACRERWSA